ncbi:unnamed protein product [Blepharisma stoltei]|uniref:TF-B3 domain-containing protein n=1 Tax=Blepharisma stoltei TaxID=1481888 RepID=A0AAU9K6X9_9CILI|nr:unnamed protein product [Blepharisma stoltei]
MARCARLKEIIQLASLQEYQLCCVSVCSLLQQWLFVSVVDEAGGGRHEEVVGDARSSGQNFYLDQNWSNFIFSQKDLIMIRFRPLYQKLNFRSELFLIRNGQTEKSYGRNFIK